MKTPFITAAVSALLIAGPAAADNLMGADPQMTTELESTVGAGQPSFDQLDIDGNGVVTRNEAEARAGLTDDWEGVDKNEDGQLNRAEFSAFEEEDLEDRAKELEKAADEAEDRIDRAN